MSTKDLKRIAIEKIVKAGYEYAKYKYDNWIEEYCQYDDNEESYYKDSIDSNGHPFENYFVDQISEESYHNVETVRRFDRQADFRDPRESKGCGIRLK